MLVPVNEILSGKHLAVCSSRACFCSMVKIKFTELIEDRLIKIVSAHFFMNCFCLTDVAFSLIWSLCHASSQSKPSHKRLQRILGYLYVKTKLWSYKAMSIILIQPPQVPIWPGKLHPAPLVPIWPGKLHPAPLVPIWPGKTIPSTSDTYFPWRNPDTQHPKYPLGLEKLYLAPQIPTWPGKTIRSTSDTWPGETTPCTSDNHFSGINYILHLMLHQITVCPGETTFPV